MNKYALTIILCCAIGALNIHYAEAQQPKRDIRPLKAVNNQPVQEMTDLSRLFDSSGKSLKDAGIREQGGVKTKSNVGALLLQPNVSKAKALPGVHANSPDLGIIKAENGSIRWMTGDLGTTPKGKILNDEEYAVTALRILGNYTFELGLNEPENELRMISNESDALGFSHLKFQQMHRDIPVWASELLTHFDASGNLYAVNGNYRQTSVSNTDHAAIAAESAIQAVKDDLKAMNRWKPVSGAFAQRLGLNEITSELVYYPIENRALVLAYEITLHPNFFEQYTYLVDAVTGSVLKRIRESCSIRYDENFMPTEVHLDDILPDMKAATPRPGVFADASGVDLNGVTQNFRVYKIDGGKYNMLWDLPNLDIANADPYLENEFTGGGVTIKFNANEEIIAIETTDNNWNDAIDISAHSNMFVAYEYYRTTFSRNAIDGNDKTIISITNYKEEGLDVDNAFWSKTYMIYGNGKDVFEPLAGGLDVAGHEMTHGVIQHSAGLVYEFQSGALNESFADVFGVLIEDRDYMIGDDIIKQGMGSGLRDLLNPDNQTLFDPQPAHMNEYANLTAEQDNGGVHINSGIPNRAAALIMESIGWDKTGAIYYRALTNYMTRNSDFVDARLAVLQAATDLFGEGSNEAAAVNSSFDAVGILADDGKPDSDGSVNPVVGGSSHIAFIDQTGTVGMFDVSDPNNIQKTTFNAKARIIPEQGSYTQLSTPLSGERIWFIGEDGYLRYIDIASGNIFYFPNAYVSNQGDLWNAAVSPDESVVALVSAYESDAKLYFYGEAGMLGSINLIPQAPQQGMQSPKLEYPDVISWSTDNQNLKIAFDALRLDNLLGKTNEFWGIYEMDFSTNRIFELIPNFNSSISLGNITYSNTNSNVFAFNELTHSSGVFETYIADFNQNKFFNLEIASAKMGDNYLTDVERPSFSPDDSWLVFSSYNLHGLFFMELATGDMTYFNTTNPVFAPNWFMFGGEQTTSVEEGGLGLPKELALYNNYPNPFNPETMIHFEVPQQEHVLLEVFDVIGRKVATLIDGRLAAGTHTANFNAANLSSGVYIARLSSGQASTIKKMLLVK